MAPFFSFLLPLLSIIFLLSSRPLLVEATHHLTNSRTDQLFSKLFVVGDSYVDTGNSPISTSDCWKVPYGMTTDRGYPTGRYSDGLLFTDFLAKHIGLETTPVAYEWRNMDPEETKKYGMNFAEGGTGVFNTTFSNDNFTVQIDRFEEVIKNGPFYTQDDITSSLTYVALSGNDYFTFLNQNHNPWDLADFIQEVVDQLKLDLKRIHGLGVGKVAVSSLSPLGCSPGFTSKSSFQNCNETINLFARKHNQLLDEAVDELNKETQPSTFVIANLYDAFYSVINGMTKSPIENPLVPCCVGVPGVVKSYCATIDDKANPTYTVCPNPGSALYWDMIHPTQAGWQAVFSALPPLF